MSHSFNGFYTGIDIMFLKISFLSVFVMFCRLMTQSNLN